MTIPYSALSDCKWEPPPKPPAKPKEQEDRRLACLTDVSKHKKKTVSRARPDSSRKYKYLYKIFSKNYYKNFHKLIKWLFFCLSLRIALIAN